MKSYVTERQLRLVGKAWEIREWLRQQRRALGNDAVLTEVLASKTVHGDADIRRPALRVV